MDYNPVASRSGSATVYHSEMTKARYESDESAHEAYGGAWYGRYMPWYWLIWVFLVPIIVFILLLVFPMQWNLCVNPITNIVSVDLVKTFGISVVVGLFIVLIFWAFCRFC